MARDRQRAKARKQRRLPRESKRDDARTPDVPGVPGDPGDVPDVSGASHDDDLLPQEQPIHRENVPGPFEHSGEVDEFEAALVSGADGEPEADPDAAERAALGDEADAEDAFGREREEEAPPVVGAVAARGSDAPAHGPGGGRFINFLRASWAELQRVQWPDRRQVGQATAVVLGFVVVAGLFLGAADYVAKELVDFII